MRAFIVSMCAVLPLVAADAWIGFRVALTDPVLSVIAPSEQPLSVRSSVGLWAMGLALGWFALAYWQRRMTLWEAALVVAGGAAALARVGNAWIFALALIVPLARQLAILRVRPVVLAAAAGIGLLASAYIGVATRPPALPADAAHAALATAASGNVLADWRWAGDVQRQFGDTRDVLAAHGLATESPDFWVDYVRIANGHERWTEALQRLDVKLLVLETTQQATAASLVRSSSDWRVVYDAEGALVAERIAQ